uniref:Uncharacterized protein n=1 Tax=Glossina pallidipes TaxID=7398 RepID=A0A1A9Z5M5_GLOPL
MMRIKDRSEDKLHLILEPMLMKSNLHSQTLTSHFGSIYLLVNSFKSNLDETDPIVKIVPEFIFATILNTYLSVGQLETQLNGIYYQVLCILMFLNPYTYVERYLEGVIKTIGNICSMHSSIVVIMRQKCEERKYHLICVFLIIDNLLLTFIWKKSCSTDADDLILIFKFAATLELFEYGHC